MDLGRDHARVGVDLEARVCAGSQRLGDQSGVGAIEERHNRYPGGREFCQGEECRSRTRVDQPGHKAELTGKRQRQSRTSGLAFEYDRPARVQRADETPRRCILLRHEQATHKRTPSGCAHNPPSTPGPPPGRVARL